MDYYLLLKRIPVLLLFQFHLLFAAAQAPDDLLNQWSRKWPVEKAYLHTDRENYIAGETIWFKAYLYSEYQPDTISSSLYVELVSSNGDIKARSVFPVLIGGTNGQIDIPDSFFSGLYTLRAYTSSMASRSPGFIFTKGVYIYGKKNMDSKNIPSASVKMDFFPEGGNLVYGFASIIAFKATNENGFPVPINAVLKNNKGDVITSISPYHDGMGMFELKPLTGEQYYAEAGGIKYPLPVPVEKGIVLTLIPHPQGHLFEIQQNTGDPSFTTAYMIGQMQNRVVFKQEFSSVKESLQGVIDTRQLHSGILQVTVFNKNGIPLAERLCFVQNKEYGVAGEILEDTIDFNSKSRNRFRISLRDTIQGSISVSITDADYEEMPVRENNILTTLLLTSDIKGYVHRPAFYFSADNDSVKTAMDLLMMTNGWRRFRWTELGKQGSPPVSDPAFITLTGKINIRGTNRPFTEKAVLLMINNISAKKSRSTHMLQTGKEGNFTLDSLVFFDRNRLLFSDTRGKKSQYIDVKLSSDTLHRRFTIPHFVIPFKETASPVIARWQTENDAIRRAEGVLLEEVIIKSQGKNKMQTVDEKYTSGLFSGDASKAIDLVNSDEAVPYSNIFDYLRFRVNGLQVAADGADYSVFYRQGGTISSLGNIPMTLFLDEIETDASVIATIPANQVALVKLYTTFAGASGNAPGGVLAIYTRKGEDNVNPVFANTLVYNGYSVVKEFYTPDYKMTNTTDKADNRITLDWRPNIFVNNINPRIPISFYNNDRTRKFKVVVEGVTISGKLICLEKIITRDNK